MGNARVQLTTWNPTLKDAAKIPGATWLQDYAGKHWSGLIRDYYAVRARLLLDQALSDADAARTLDRTVMNRRLAELAYNWTTSLEPYPTEIQGDALEVSRAMFEKYKPYYSACTSAETVSLV